MKSAIMIQLICSAINIPGIINGNESSLIAGAFCFGMAVGNLINMLNE